MPQTSLWQRLFIYPLLLIIATHSATFLFFYQAARKNRALHLHAMSETTSDTAASVEGGSLESVEAFMKIFNHHQNRLWLESPDGEIISGTLIPGFDQERRKSFPATRFMDNPATILDTALPDAEFIGVIPVRLDNQQAVLFLGFYKYQPLPIRSLFLEGLLAITLIGGFLAVWAAWKISLPLRRLRNEVLEIAAGDLSLRVSDKGEGEIAELAVAVNTLADGLSKKITSGQELITNISHELRSPIGRIRLSAAIVEESMRAEYSEDCEAPPAINARLRHLGMIQEETVRLDTLIGSLTLFRKLELQRDLPLQPIDFSGLCSKMAESYTALMESRELVFQIAILPGLWVRGDETLLCTLVSNLLDNAAKYTNKGDQVRLALTVDGGIILLEVENNHPHMSEEWLTDIFTPFHRGNIPDGHGEGVGLGLDLVKKVAALHQGSILARNSETGVCFVLSLPLLLP